MGFEDGKDDDAEEIATVVLSIFYSKSDKMCVPMDTFRALRKTSRTWRENQLTCGKTKASFPVQQKIGR